MTADSVSTAGSDVVGSGSGSSKDLEAIAVLLTLTADILRNSINKSPYNSVEVRLLVIIIITTLIVSVYTCSLYSMV